MPQEVIFGPSHFGSLGLCHLHMEQGSKQALACLRHLRHRGPVGKMLKIAVQWFQRLLGISFSAFKNMAISLPHMEGAWFISIHKFLNESECKLQTTGIHKVQQCRWCDCVLMDDALTLDLENRDTRRINRVHLFLQVECLSEICAPDRTRLEEQALDVVPAIPSRSQKLWPCQAPPGPKSQTAWKHFLMTMHCGSANGKLVQALGPQTMLTDRTWPHNCNLQTHCIAIQRQAC